MNWKFLTHCIFTYVIAVVLGIATVPLFPQFGKVGAMDLLIMGIEVPIIVWICMKKGWLES